MPPPRDEAEAAPSALGSGSAKLFGGSRANARQDTQQRHAAASPPRGGPGASPEPAQGACSGVGAAPPAASEGGLSSREAQKRLWEDGLNLLDIPPPGSLFASLVRRARNSVVVLTFAIGVAACLGALFAGGPHAGIEAAMAALLVVFAVAAIVADAVGNSDERGMGHSASGAASVLSMTHADGERPVHVVRDNQEVIVKAQDVVVGDLVRFSAGDLAPADVLLFESLDLSVDESALTGEPEPRGKRSEPLAPLEARGRAMLPNVVYAGTAVIAGSGSGEVLATGMRTQLGLVARHLQAAAASPRPSPPLQAALHRLGPGLSAACLGVAVAAVALSYFTGYRDMQDACPEGDDACIFRASLLRGLRLALIAAPHGLPLLLLYILRAGRSALAAQRVHASGWSAVDVLGAASVICADKTGALTQGTVAAKELIGLCKAVPNAPAMELHMELYPINGLSANGGVFEASKLGKEARQRMDLKFDPRARRQDFAEPGLPDLSAPRGAEAAHLGSQLVQAHLVSGFLNCYGSKLLRDPNTGAWSAGGTSAQEAAVAVAAAKGGFWEEEGLGARLLHVTYSRRADLEVPLAHGRSMAATVHALPKHRALASMQFAEDATHCAIIRGPPEQLLPHVRSVIALGNPRTPPRSPHTPRGVDTPGSPAGGAAQGAVLSSPLRTPPQTGRSNGSDQLSPRSARDTPSRPGGSRLLVPGQDLAPAERRLLEARGRDLAARGLGGLVVAVCPLSAAEVEALNAAKSVEQRLEALLSCPRLCFLTLWGAADPPRPLTAVGARACRDAGVRLVMLAGDEEPGQAELIARQVGLLPASTTTAATAVAIGAAAAAADIEGVGSLSAAASASASAAAAANRAVGGTAMSCGGLRCGGWPVHVPKGYSRKLSRRAVALIDSGGAGSGGSSGGQLLLGHASGGGGGSIDTDARLFGSSDRDEDQAPRYRSKDELSSLAARSDVWSCALPSDKVALVEALRREGHVVVVFGACAGSAAAMAHADAGVAIGACAPPATLAAADLLLGRSEPTALVAAVAEGRLVHAASRRCAAFALGASAGECASILLALAIGLPLPLQGLQFVLCLVAARLLPSLAMAYEKPDPDLMQAPPRDVKGHFLIAPSTWLLRVIPFAMLLPLAAIASLAAETWASTGHFSVAHLAMSFEANAVERGVAPCQAAGSVDKEGHFVGDAAPFHCRCRTRPDGNPFSPIVAEVDQWGSDVSAKQLAHDFDRFTGSAPSFNMPRTPWKDGIDALTYTCLDAHGTARRCWREGEARRPVLPLDLNCAAYGARLGQSTAFATIFLGELLTLLSFRGEGWLFSNLCSNKAFVGLFTLGLLVLAAALYAPVLADALGLAPLGAGRLGLAAALALGLCASNELAKVVYRNRAAHAKGNGMLGKIALQRHFNIQPLKEC